MLGDVWEWTSSAFTGYPGFTAFPYAEYSEVFFGDEHRVLRGGSWATDPLVARVTLRTGTTRNGGSSSAVCDWRPTHERDRVTTTAEIAVLFSAEERNSNCARRCGSD